MDDIVEFTSRQYGQTICDEGRVINVYKNGTVKIDCAGTFYKVKSKDVCVLRKADS